MLLRLYELDETDENLIQDITYASQNPIDLRDFRANDDIQQKLELAVKDLDYEYKRKREKITSAPNIISSHTAAILAIWRRKHHLVKFREKDIFGQFYPQIFNDKLSAAQLIMAVLILKMVESEHKRRVNKDKTPRFLAYASYFLAMLVGEVLLEKLNIPL